MALTVKNPARLAAIARRAGLKVQSQTTVWIASTGIHTGTGIWLPGWDYPIVVDNEGVVHYDLDNGEWGDIEELHRLLQQCDGGGKEN